MSDEAEKLCHAINTASNNGGVIVSGLAPLLRLMVSWILSVEVRLRNGQA